ncbi:N-acetylglucosamine-6-phosphate deacetylase [Rhodobacteraceae bacterium S2214]|nr:N-acetylglucosamine-6-phosphate deacetylase [Rhodobacteraceae bacterium S2214]
MTHWISADQVFDGRNLRDNCAVGIKDGVITQIEATDDLAAEHIHRHHQGIITPGFFDIQVNGGGGVMLNSDPSAAGIAKIAAAHRTFGTTALFPTVITDRPEVLDAAVAAAIDAIGVDGFAGLHIEGPHIDTARRGTHAERYIRPCDAHTINLVRTLRDHDIPTLITVAPEAISVSQISTLRDMGAVVSIGHSDADAATTQQAIDAGATCFTHLFNAMSPMLSRAPGVTGTAIASDAWCSFIADGHHVDPTMLLIAMNARPTRHRMIAVSDAMATVGGPDHFDLYGHDIFLKDGRLVNAEGALAGAHLTLLEALQNMVGFGVPLETALQMCGPNVYDLIGLDTRGTLINQPARDVLALNSDLSLIAVGVA